jgi:pimeloyl-ACP methyl ester carboxylesterase
VQTDAAGPLDAPLVDDASTLPPCHPLGSDVMGEVTVGDARVAYDVQGSADAGAPPLVLIHGTTQDRTGWATITPALEATHRIVLPEMPGSGQTVDGAGPLDLDEIVTQIVAVADDALGDATAPFALGGYSLGAVVAAATAARLGRRVTSLSLLCGWATSDAHIRFELALWRDLLERDVETFLRHAFSHGFTDAWFDMVGDEMAGVMAQAGVALVNGLGAARQADLDMRIDIADRLGEVTAPTLVIGATADRFIPFRHSEELAKGIPGARLESIDAGHLCILERAEDVARLMTEHLASNGAH